MDRTMAVLDYFEGLGPSFYVLSGFVRIENVGSRV